MKAQLKKWYMYLCRHWIKNETLEEGTVFLCSFPKNNNGWLEEWIALHPNMPIVIACNKKVKEEYQKFKEEKNVRLLSLEPSFVFFREVLPFIAKQKYIFADNYFAFLAAFPFQKEQKIIQLWHADGAIKQFGRENPQNEKRSLVDQQRFEEVYAHFTHYIVGSKRMGEVFMHSYGAKEEQILPFGFVRTDAYFKKENRQKWEEEVENIYPEWQGKTVILYAPTYREYEEQDQFPREKIRTLEDVILIERYHPHSRFSSTEIAISNEALWLRTDILITDYSSIPFEYSLLHKKGTMIFYQYDQEEYQKASGIQPLMTDWPGVIVKTKGELCSAIQQRVEISYERFNEQWNEYNQGTTVQQITEWMKEQ